MHVVNICSAVASSENNLSNVWASSHQLKGLKPTPSFPQKAEALPPSSQPATLSDSLHSHKTFIKINLLL